MAHPIQTSYSEEQPPHETTPLLQRTQSFHFDITAKKNHVPSAARPTLFAFLRPHTWAPVAPSTSPTDSSDEPLDADLNRVLARDEARRDSKRAFTSSQTVSLTLENSGSVARDHLASERTFLAYVRTSLAIASAGVALAQILSFTKFSSEEKKRSKYVESYARPLGGIAILISLGVLCMGVVRYFSIQRALVKGFFPVSRVGVTSLALLLGTLVTMTFGILLVDRLKER